MRIARINVLTSASVNKLRLETVWQVPENHARIDRAPEPNDFHTNWNIDEMLNFNATQSFDSVHLFLQSVPGCEDASLSSSRAWVWNAFTSAKKLPASELTGGGIAYEGCINIGRRPQCEIVLKDKAISGKHAVVTWTATVTPGHEGELCEGNQYGPNHNVSVSMTLQDCSTNGSYNATKKVSKDEILPLGLKISGDTGRCVFVVQDELPPVSVISLGKPRGETDEQRPVFAFIVGILAGHPWHIAMDTPISPVLLDVLPFHPTDVVPVKMGYKMKDESVLRVTPRSMGDRRSVDKANIDDEIMKRRREQLAESTQTIKGLREEVAKSQGKSRDLEMKCSELSRKVESLTRQLEEKVATSEMEDRIVRKRMTTLQDALNQSQKEKSDITMELNEVREEIERVMLKLKQADMAKELTEKQLRDASKVNDELRVEITRKVAAERARIEAEKELHLEELQATLGRDVEKLQNALLLEQRAIAAMQRSKQRNSKVMRTIIKSLSDLLDAETDHNEHTDVLTKGSELDDRGCRKRSRVDTQHILALREISNDLDEGENTDGATTDEEEIKPSVLLRRRSIDENEQPAQVASTETTQHD